MGFFLVILITTKCEQKQHKSLCCVHSCILIVFLLCFSNMFAEDVADVWNYENSVEQYQSTGGTSKAMVEKQISQLEDWLGKQS